MEVTFPSTIKTVLIVGSLALALFYLLRNKFSDGFPYDRSEAEEVLAIIKYMNDTNLFFVLGWYSGAYLARKLLPISGICSMHIIAGALYGNFFGVLLCVSLTTLAAILTYSATQLALDYCFRPESESDELEVHQEPPPISTLINLQVDGIPNADSITAGTLITISPIRQAGTLQELVNQSLFLGVILFVNEIFHIVPTWAINLFMAAAQFPLPSFILSTLLTCTCGQVTLAGKFLEQPQFLHELQTSPFLLYIILIAWLASLICNLKYGDYYLFNYPNGFVIAQPTQQQFIILK